MKNSTLAASLLALNLFHLLPEGTHSFTTIPITTTTTTTTTSFRDDATIRRSTITNLNGLPPLPGFLTRNRASADEETTTASAVLSKNGSTDIPELPGQGAKSNENMTTESALETTTTATATDVAENTCNEAIGETQQLSETQTLLQKVKQAGTAGGGFPLVYL